MVPLDNDGCAEGIVKLINNTALQGIITNKLFFGSYGNESEAGFLDMLLG